MSHFGNDSRWKQGYSGHAGKRGHCGQLVTGLLVRRSRKKLRYSCGYASTVVRVRRHCPTAVGWCSSCRSTEVEACARAAESAFPSAARTSFSILLLSNGLRMKMEQSAATAHSTAEM